MAPAFRWFVAAGAFGFGFWAPYSRGGESGPFSGPPTCDFAGVDTAHRARRAEKTKPKGSLGNEARRRRARSVPGRGAASAMRRPGVRRVRVGRPRLASRGRPGECKRVGRGSANGAPGKWRLLRGWRSFAVGLGRGAKSMPLTCANAGVLSPGPSERDRGTAPTCDFLPLLAPRICARGAIAASPRVPLQANAAEAVGTWVRAKPDRFRCYDPSVHSAASLVCICLSTCGFFHQEFSTLAECTRRGRAARASSAVQAIVVSWQKSKRLAYELDKRRLAPPARNFHSLCNGSWSTMSRLHPDRREAS